MHCHNMNKRCPLLSSGTYLPVVLYFLNSQNLFLFEVWSNQLKLMLLSLGMSLVCPRILSPLPMPFYNRYNCRINILISFISPFIEVAPLVSNMSGITDSSVLNFYTRLRGCWAFSLCRPESASNAN